MDETNYSEQAAIAKAIVGDERGYRYLLEKYKSYAFSIAIRIVKNEQEAEEVVQDSFIKAFKSIARFKKLGKFSTWLYKIVYNTSLTSIRRARINMDFLGDCTDFGLELPDSYINGFEKLIEKDKAVYINKAISRLPELESVAVTLYYNNQCTILEIEDITGWKTSTIKTRLHRARQNLYVELSKLLRDELNNLR
jgi:RNA polymerase sigma-70 factor (ECF subfamily)